MKKGIKKESAYMFCNTWMGRLTNQAWETDNNGKKKFTAIKEDELQTKVLE